MVTSSHVNLEIHGLSHKQAMLQSVILGLTQTQHIHHHMKDKTTLKKIGEFPINIIKDAIDDAKSQFMDLQTQVNIAVNLMGQLLVSNDMALLVLTDIRVDKDKNIVSVRCSDGIGRPDKWMSVVDICEDYGVNKDGVQ